MSAPALTILIVTYNSRHLIDACLTSLHASRIDRTFEVVIVDNASSDGTPDRIAAAWPDIRLIAESVNHGFAGANAIGFAAARGSYVLLLNPDAFTRDPEAVAATAAHLDAHLEIGACGCRLTFADGRHQVGDAGHEPAPVTTLVHALGLSGRLGLKGLYLSGREAASAGPVAVDWLCGAFVMMRREAVEAIGGLSSPLFLYGEDIDWGCRLKDAGWASAYLPHIAVVHLQGGAGSLSPRWLDGLAGIYDLRNRNRALGARAWFYAPMWAGLTLRGAVYGLAGRLLGRPALQKKSRDMWRFANHLRQISAR